MVEHRLVVFCGLPGVGKTTLSRLTADVLGATFLRIDTIEAAIVATLMPYERNPVGYVVAEGVAADQLRGGRSVVADAVNSVQIARDGWRAVAARHGVPVHFVEVTCRDGAEHRRRVELRSAEMEGHGVPTWSQVCRRGFEPIAEPSLTVDNIGDPAPLVERIVRWLANADAGA